MRDKCKSECATTRVVRFAAEGPAEYSTLRAFQDVTLRVNRVHFRGFRPGVLLFVGADLARSGDRLTGYATFEYRGTGWVDVRFPHLYPADDFGRIAGLIGAHPLPHER